MISTLTTGTPTGTVTYLKRLLRIWSFLCIDLERAGEVVFEYCAERIRVLNLRRSVRCNEIQRLERVLIQIRRFALVA